MFAGRLVLVAAILGIIAFGAYRLAQRQPAAPWSAPAAPTDQLITSTPSPDQEEDVLNADDYLGEALQDLRAVE